MIPFYTDTVVNPAATALDRACVADTWETRHARILRLDQGRSLTSDFRLLTVIRLGVFDNNNTVAEMTADALGTLINDIHLNTHFSYLRHNIVRAGAILHAVTNRLAVGYVGGGRAALLPREMQIVPACAEIFGNAALGGFAPLANEAPRIIR